MNEKMGSNLTRDKLRRLVEGYADTDRRMIRLEFDCDSLMSRFGAVMPSKKFLAKIVEIYVPQIELMRLLHCTQVNRRFKQELRIFIEKCDGVDGLKTDFDKSVSRVSFVEERWRNGVHND